MHPRRSTPTPPYIYVIHTHFRPIYFVNHAGLGGTIQPPGAQLHCTVRFPFCQPPFQKKIKDLTSFKSGHIIIS